MLELDMMECINIPKWMNDEQVEEASDEDGDTGNEDIISWAFGVAIGRFDIRYMTEEKETLIIR